MRVVNTSVLADFMREHAASRKALSAWLAEAKEARWSTPADIKAAYPKASVLDDRRIVFDIGGNKYRLLCAIAYKTGVIEIVRLGTHAEYDKWRL